MKFKLSNSVAVRALSLCSGVVAMLLLAGCGQKGPLRLPSASAGTAAAEPAASAPVLPVRR